MEPSEQFNEKQEALVFILRRHMPSPCAENIEPAPEDGIYFEWREHKFHLTSGIVVLELVGDTSRYKPARWIEDTVISSLVRSIIYRGRLDDWKD